MAETTSEIYPYLKLKFQLDNPNLEDCYLEGYKNALIDMTEDNNPFHQGSRESEQWLEGWWTGFYGNEPLYGFSKDELGERISHREANFLLRKAANEPGFEGGSSTITKVAKVAAAVAATFLGYQVLDMIA